jgi:hypothetical protein
MVLGGVMNIVEALHEEESKLERQLSAVKVAISALNGGTKSAVRPIGAATNTNSIRVKRTMSAAVRAKIARSAKARWAKLRAEKAKKVK